MKTNPELQRNLWLEITPYRLVSMPFIIAAVAYLAFVSDGYHLGTTVASVTVGLFFVISLIWGTKLAAETVMNEIRDHTWDGQRMSVLTPWELTCGKLFGSTLYTWYGGAICLVLYLAAAATTAPEQSLRITVSLFLTGILAHSVSLLVSLLALQKERRYNRSLTSLLLLFGLFIAGPFFSLTFEKQTRFIWYGTSFSSLDLLLVTIFVCAVWGVLGVYSMMRLELQMKNMPWVWYGFVLFVMMHLAGFADSGSIGNHGMAAAAPAPLIAYGVALASVYIMAFVERKDFLTLQGLLRLIRGGNRRRLLERAPRWLLTVPVVTVMGLILIVTVHSDISGAMLNIVGFVVASLCFLGRDLGIILFCNFGRSKRGDILALICLGLLYGVIPGIFSVMKAEPFTALFWPGTAHASIYGCLAAAAELLLAAWLVSVRWRQRVAEAGR